MESVILVGFNSLVGFIQFDLRLEGVCIYILFKAIHIHLGPFLQLFYNDEDNV